MTVPPGVVGCYDEWLRAFRDFQVNQTAGTKTLEEEAALRLDWMKAEHHLCSGKIPACMKPAKHRGACDTPKRVGLD